MPQLFKIGNYWVYFWSNILNNIKRIIELKTDYITQKWQERFGEISYYC